MRQVLLALTTIIAVASLAAVGSYAHFSDTEMSQDNYLETGSLDLQLADADEGFTDDPLYDSVTRSWYYKNSYPPGMTPGDSVQGVVYLQNVGDSNANRLDIYCHIVDIELDNDTDSENDAENYILIDTGKDVDNDFDGLTDEDNADGIDNDGDGLVDEDPDPDVSPNVTVDAGRGVYDKSRVMIITYMTYQNAFPTDIVWNDGTAWDTAYIDDVDLDGKITLFDFKKHPVLNLLPPVSGLANLSMKVTFGEASAGLDEYQGDQTQMTLTFNLK